MSSPVIFISWISTRSTLSLLAESRRSALFPVFWMSTKAPVTFAFGGVARIQALLNASVSDACAPVTSASTSSVELRKRKSMSELRQ